MSTETAVEAPSGLSRRQRARLTRGSQYAVGLVVLVFLVLKTDWATFSQAFLRGDIFAAMWPRVVTIGMVNTLIYTALAFAFGLSLGLVIAMMKLSSIGPYRWFANGYVELFRGLPALVVLFMVAFGIPSAFPGFQFPGDIYGKVMIGLGLTAAAYMAETIRAGIQAVPKGQIEAARSLGMSGTRTMISILLPQAFRIIIPPLTNELILLIKDSSLVYVLGVTVEQYELTKFSQGFLNSRASPTPLIVGALCYLVLTLPLSSLVRMLERRFAKAR
ncbi:MAG: amino acid ABC transporter permease [Dermatophilaceae bacterium]